MHNFIGKKINKNRNNINVTEFYFKIELKQGIEVYSIQIWKIN